MDGLLFEIVFDKMERSGVEKPSFPGGGNNHDIFQCKVYPNVVVDTKWKKIRLIASTYHTHVLFSRSLNFHSHLKLLNVPLDLTYRQTSRISPNKRRLPKRLKMQIIFQEALGNSRVFSTKKYRPLFSPLLDMPAMT